LRLVAACRLTDDAGGFFLRSIPVQPPENRRHRQIGSRNGTNVALSVRNIVVAPESDHQLTFVTVSPAFDEKYGIHARWVMGLEVSDHLLRCHACAIEVYYHSRGALF
jgi:hypothetical protein